MILKNIKIVLQWNWYVVYHTVKKIYICRVCAAMRDKKQYIEKQFEEFVV